MWAIIAVLGAYNSGNIKNYFSEETSYYTDRRAYWREFSGAFTDLRLEVWQMNQACQNNSISKAEKDKLITSTKNSVENYFKNFLKIGFNLDVYFPSESKEYSKLIETMLPFNLSCQNASFTANKLLVSERKIIDPMFSVVYGFNPKRSQISDVAHAIDPNAKPFKKSNR